MANPFFPPIAQRAWSNPNSLSGYKCLGKNPHCTCPGPLKNKDVYKDNYGVWCKGCGEGVTSGY